MPQGKTFLHDNNRIGAAKDAASLPDQARHRNQNPAPWGATARIPLGAQGHAWR